MSRRRKRRDDADEDDAPQLDKAAPEEPEVEPSSHRESGPFDVTEVDPGPDAEQRIDLGSLLIPLAEEMEIRVEMDAASEEPMAVTLIVEDGAVQLKTYAAPRSGGLWARARGEVSQEVTSDGGTIDEREGPFGPELLAHVPAVDDKKRPFVQTIRFVAVEGPRWMLQGVFLGAGTSPDEAARLEGLFRGVVVVRGDQAMPPGTALPLRLPADVAEEVALGPDDEDLDYDDED